MTAPLRTFDCPWCGAISPVPADHLGEHFSCPECHKATKLTATNTGAQPPTEAPPDAPHTSGHRTFDCPWCGAIAPIPASHLGERFHCPECGKETKLTPTNTRSAELTAPPPDAPHVETGGGGRGVLVGVAVLAIGVAAWWFTRPGPDAGSKSTAKGNPPAGRPAGRPEPTPPGVPSPAAPAAGTPAPAAPTPEAPTVPPPSVPAPVAPTPPATPPAPVPEDVERVARQGELTKALEAAADAAKRHDEARAALDAFVAAHPGAEQAAADAAALDALRAERTRRAEGATTVEAARAGHAAMVTFVEADPGRVRLAERVLSWLRADLDGREAAGAATWRDLHWTGLGVDRALGALSAAAASAAVPPPADLVRAEQDLRRAREDATRRADEAKARLDGLPAPK